MYFDAYVEGAIQPQVVLKTSVIVRDLPKNMVCGSLYLVLYSQGKSPKIETRARRSIKLGIHYRTTWPDFDILGNLYWEKNDKV